MIGNTIRQRLIILTLLVLLLALAGSLFIADRSFSVTLRQSTYTQLANNATYLKQELERDGYVIDPDRFDSYARATALRITIIGKNGVVLYDSDHEEATMDNHLYRQEVQEALDAGSATSERRSATQRLPVLYHAIRVDDVPEIAVLRLSTTLNQLQSYQQTYQRLFFGGIAVLIVLVSIATAFSITMLTRPLAKIKEGASRYAEGDLMARITIDSPKEMAELAATMQEMALRLRSTIGEVESGRQQVQTILEHMNEGILLADRSLVIKVANQAAVTFLFGHLPEGSPAIEGSALVRLISSTEITGACEKTLADGKPREVTIAHHGHLFGETAQVVGREHARTLKLLAVPVRSGSDIDGIVLTVNDITELRRLEQMRKDFVANVSHELKTPITAIAGFAQTLHDGAKEQPQELERFLSIILRQATNMQRIVEDLLLLSSLEQQQTAPAKTWNQVEQLLDETVESCRFRAEQKRSTIAAAIENPNQLELLANGPLIVQALSNLVVNAITYSDEGSTVHLKTTVDERTVHFHVIDTGQGIPKESQQRIFERFYRVDAARSRSRGGTGLGLSIVKHIVQVHGGTVKVASELGKGTTFTISLPRSGSEMNSLQGKSEALFSTGRKGGR